MELFNSDNCTHTTPYEYNDPNINTKSISSKLYYENNMNQKLNFREASHNPYNINSFLNSNNNIQSTDDPYSYSENQSNSIFNNSTSNPSISNQFHINPRLEESFMSSNPVLNSQCSKTLIVQGNAGCTYHIPQNNANNTVNVDLIDKTLWRRFNGLGNEMIITKSGRRTFPYMTLRVTGLTPNIKYSIQLGVEPVNLIRWKYTSTSGWQPNKHENTEFHPQFIEHTDSGKLGEQIEGKLLNFKHIKLTNHPTTRPTHFFLKSMHYYTFRVIVASILPGNVYYVVFNHCFEECNFFAVTAYQNKSITKLKIERNPYAKGFLTSEKKVSDMSIDTKEQMIDPEQICFTKMVRN